MLLLGYSLPLSAQVSLSRTAVQKDTTPKITRNPTERDNPLVEYVIGYTGSLSVCPGSSVILTATNAPDGAIFQWKKDNVNIANATGKTYAASEPGEYTVIVSSPPNIGPYDTVTVKQFPKPVVTFTTDQNNVCSGTKVTFTSTVTGGKAPYKYSWKFGDGQVSTLKDPVIALDSLGCGTVNLSNQLIVEDANGCRDTVRNVIALKQAPRVEIQDRDNIFTPFKNCRNADSQSDSSYTLTISNISPDKNCISTYSVKWGDGTEQNNLTAASFPLTHTYKALGAFNLVVTAVGTNGCSRSKTYQVANQSNPAGGLGTLGATTGLCAPAKIPFIISNWQKNSPGTTYLLDFGDGTSVTLNHPLNAELVPDTVYHTYSTSSCPNFTFEAKLTVINACDRTPYTAGNIQIRIKPKAAIDEVLAACVGENTCFINKTVLGNFGPTCSSLTKFTWDFGDPGSGSGNTSNAENPCHKFSAPGIYTVTLTAENPCGITSATRQVCVTEKPVPAFTLDKESGCGTVTVKATNQSNALSGCSPAKLEWSVNYTPAFCGTTADWKFAGGTTASSVSPSFEFSKPGKYLITLTITNACGTFTTSKQVAIKSPPQVTLDPVQNACGPVTVRPSALVVNCGETALSYKWTFQGGTPASATTADPGQVTFAGAGSKTITLEVTNECGTTSQSKQFLISEIPQLTVPASAEYCPGVLAGPFVFTSTTPGATFSWTASTTAIGLPASSGNGNIAAFTTTNNTAVAIASLTKVTATAAGCSQQSEFTIKVNPTPALPVVTTPVTYCKDATAVPLSANAGANALKWYTTASGGTGSSTAPTPSTAAVGSTTYYVSQVDGKTGCEGPRAAITVTVNPVPALSSTSSTNPTACATATGTITLNGLMPDISYTVSYLKNGAGQTASLRSNASGAVTLTGLSAGTYTAVKITLNGCSSAEAGPFTLTDPNPPAAPVVTSNTPLCSGATLQLNATTAGAGSFIYSWTGPGGFTSSLQNPSRSNAIVTMSGSYFVTVTLNGCTSPAAQADVVVSETPAVPVLTSNSPVCAGNTLSLTSNTGFNGPLTYAWTGPNNFTSNQPNPVINNADIAASGDYKLIVTASAGACASGQATVTAVVNKVPVITKATISSPQSCTNPTGSINLEGLDAGKTYTVRYKKNNSAREDILTAGSDGVVVIPNLGSGTYSEVEVVLNNCASNNAGPFVLTDPNPPATPTVTANTPLCSGTTLELNASTTAVGAVTYSWSGPGGYTSADQNPTRTNATPAMNGTYAVTATLNGCTSPAATVDVAVNPTPNKPTVVSNSPVCEGSSLSLTSVSDFTGPVTYQWTGPNGFSSIQQTPVIGNAGLTAGGTYTLVVTATQGSCRAEPATIAVQINKLPVITKASGQSPARCNSPTGSITLEGLEAGKTYTIRYKKNNSAQSETLTANPNGVVTISNLGAGSYTEIEAELNSCRSLKAGPVELKDPSPPAIPDASSNGPLCGGATLQLLANTSAQGDVQFSWTGPGGFSSNAQNPVRNDAQQSMSGNYYVTTTLNGCTSLPDSVTVVVNPTPGKPELANNGPVCEGSSLAFTSSTDFTGDLRYAWSGPNGFVSTLANPVITNAQATSSGEYQLIITAVQGNCPSAVSLIQAEVNKYPVITGKTFVPPLFCASATGSISLEGMEAGKTYRVRYKKNNIAQETTSTADANGVVIIRNLTAGTYTDIEVWNNACASNRVGPFVLIDPNPPAPPVASSNSPLCSGATLELTANSSTPGNIVYTWTGPDGYTSTAQYSSRPNIQASQSGNYVVTASLEGCASQPVAVDVLVNPAPGQPVISTNSPQCTGSEIRINSTINYSGPVTYRWTGPNGFTSSDPNLLFPNAAPVLNGDYKLVVTATPGGCSAEAFTNVSVGPYPTIELGAGQTLPTGTQVKLQSAVTNGPVRTWEWTPSTNLSCNNCPEPVATIKTDITYLVRITNIYGCQATDTISFRTFCESAQVFIPNAFTPDGDGSNDILMVRARGISAVRHFRIFNRWGEVVFERNNFAPNDPSHAWDGKVRGVVQGPGVYVYTAEVICDNGAVYVYKGNVSILK